MPKELQKFTTEDGDEFYMYVEIPDAPPPKPLTTTKGGFKDAAITTDATITNSDGTVAWDMSALDFGAATKGLKPMLKQLKKMAKSIELSEIEMEVGVKFEKKVNVFVVSGSADVDFKLKLKWEIKRDKPEQVTDPEHA